MINEIQFMSLLKLGIHICKHSCGRSIFLNVKALISRNRLFIKVGDILCIFCRNSMICTSIGSLTSVDTIAVTSFNVLCAYWGFLHIGKIYFYRYCMDLCKILLDICYNSKHEKNFETVLNQKSRVLPWVRASRWGLENEQYERALKAIAWRFMRCSTITVHETNIAKQAMK